MATILDTILEFLSLECKYTDSNPAHFAEEDGEARRKADLRERTGAGAQIARRRRQPRPRTDDSGFVPGTNRRLPEVLSRGSCVFSASLSTSRGYSASKVNSHPAGWTTVHLRQVDVLSTALSERRSRTPSPWVTLRKDLTGSTVYSRPRDSRQRCYVNHV